jgi:hypothetical protein
MDDKPVFDDEMSHDHLGRSGPIACEDQQVPRLAINRRWSTPGPCPLIPTGARALHLTTLPSPRYKPQNASAGREQRPRFSPPSPMRCHQTNLLIGPARALPHSPATQWARSTHAVSIERPATPPTVNAQASVRRCSIDFVDTTRSTPSRRRTLPLVSVGGPLWTIRYYTSSYFLCCQHKTHVMS